MKKLVLALTMGVALTGCTDEQSTSKKFQQAAAAQEAAESIQFTENAEIDNISKRLQLTSDPGLTGFVLLMNDAGQPIMYTGVQGKPTSGGKRLTATKVYGRVPKSDGSGTTCCFETDAPSDEGTYGKSSPYIFFWTTSGQYIQWNRAYLYSDQPFRTNVEPLVVSVQ